MQTAKRLVINGILAATLASIPLSGLRAQVCESTKYPKLILDKDIMPDAEAFLDEALSRYHLTINNSFRSNQEQRKLYSTWIADGKRGNPVAEPGKSRHESGFAMDLNGLQKLTFNDWNNLLNTAERHGFNYLLGDFSGEGNQRFDWPHFEADPTRFGKTLQEAIDRNGLVDVTKIAKCSSPVEAPSAITVTAVQ